VAPKLRHQISSPRPRSCGWWRLPMRPSQAASVARSRRCCARKPTRPEVEQNAW